MPELDFVRGIAILMVVLLHGFFGAIVPADISKFHGIGKIFISATSGGWLGVQLFFVLSGFLITGILLDTRERSNYYKRFYINRALRILPAYFALLFLLLILGVIQWKFLFVSAFFMANFAPIFGIAMQYAPLWTLAVEEQFYLFWPQLVRRVSRKTLAIIALAIVILVPIIRLIAFIKNPSVDLYYYTWFVADGLAMGAFLSIFLKNPKNTRKKTLFTGIAMTALGAGAIIIGAPFGILHRSNIVGAMFQLFPWHILFAGFITLTLFLGTSNWKRIVNFSWVRYFGYISYGLYLIHFLIFAEFDKIIQWVSPSSNIILHATFPGLVLRFLLAGGISILIASLSRKYFESFFLNFKNKQSGI